MLLILQLLLLVCVVGSERTCYWNRKCPFLLYATKTPYDAIRGDIRDYDLPLNCKAVSIWTLIRHGNSNPEKSLTEALKHIGSFKDEIVASHEAGRGQLCEQDVDNFRKWIWNSTLEVSTFFLTATGYNEQFDTATRIRKKYPHLLQGFQEDYYFWATNEQRTFASAIAFIHGLTEGTNLTLSIDNSSAGEDILRHLKCDRFEQVAKSKLLQELEDEYFRSAEMIAVRDAVQQLLGIPRQLSAAQVFTIYEMCRIERSWAKDYQSPWCAVFTNQDLEVLEYLDDIIHYYKKGYGSWVNVKLGGLALKNLYDSFEAVIQGRGRKMTSFIVHTNMLESVWCALGIFKDPCPLQASFRNSSRLYRTSKIVPFTQNMIVVLNSCQESGAQVQRVQIFINEKETELCPLQGCTWQQFHKKFQPFQAANPDFCSLDYIVPQSDLDLVNTCL